MREVLFRGKRADNGEWAYGWYVFRDVEAGFKEQKHYIVSHDECGFLWHEVIPETVGQYAGFCYKTGEKIFEGDIVNQYEFKPGFDEIYKYPSFVAIEEGMWRVKTPHNGRYYHAPLSHVLSTTSLYTLEHIGNIHDNQELIENSQNFS